MGCISSDWAIFKLDEFQRFDKYTENGWKIGQWLMITYSNNDIDINICTKTAIDVYFQLIIVHIGRP